MVLVSELQINVIDSFELLQQSLAELEYQMTQSDKDLPVWFEMPSLLSYQEKISQRELAYLFIAQLQYVEQQEPKEILLGPGLIAASANTLDAVTKLNLAKHGFKQAMLALKNTKTNLKERTFSNKLEQAIQARPKLIARTLNSLGLSKLHLKQCYRKSPVLESQPKKVSWTWAHTRSIKKISAKEAELMLSRQGTDDGIMRQQHKLAQLPNNAVLAIVQELAPHLRANIVFQDKIANTIARKMVKGASPLFYPYKSDYALPKIKPPGPKKERDKDRDIRSDVKLDPEPFLPAIHAHKYEIA